MDSVREPAEVAVYRGAAPRGAVPPRDLREAPPGREPASPACERLAPSRRKLRLQSTTCRLERDCRSRAEQAQMADWSRPVASRDPPRETTTRPGAARAADGPGVQAPFRAPFLVDRFSRCRRS